MNDYQFGNFLYEKRTEKGLSQAELGALLGVSNKAVSKWENGAAKPQTEKLLRLAEILDVSVEALLSGGQIERSSKDRDDPQKAHMIRQWMRACRTTRIFAWILVGVLVQIPFVTGFLVGILKVNDDVGAAYVLCTMLLLITFTILTAVYSVSQKRQRRMILRLWATDPALPPVTVQSEVEGGTENPVSPAFRSQLLRLERRAANLFIGWLCIAAFPVFAYIGVVALSYVATGWDTLLFVVYAIYLGGFVWLIALPLYTLVSVILYLLCRAKLFSAHRAEYLAYRQEKKRTATKRPWYPTFAVTYCFCMLVLSAVRLFLLTTPSAFWLSASLFVILFVTMITALSILTHRLAKQSAAPISGDVSQS